MKNIHLDDILDFITNSPIAVSKRDIATHFSIKGQDQRRWLKDTLRLLVKNNQIEKDRLKTYRIKVALPPTLTVTVTRITDDAEIFGTPEKWPHETPAPELLILAKKEAGKIIIGTKILIRTRQGDDGKPEGRVIHIISAENAQLIGTFERSADGHGILYPAQKSARDDYFIHTKDCKNAEDGMLVAAEIIKTGQNNKHRGNRKHAKVIEVLGHESDPRMISLIAILQNEIRNHFPQKVIDQANDGVVPELGKREDLRDVPLVTIDGADARDFDDAVFAEPDPDPKNQGGWRIIVAIADVSYYVTPDSPLDKEAVERGNSTYFPDRVVPMLPEALSNDVCSLRPHEPRACMAAHMRIDRHGQLIDFKFTRALMQSHARLIYEDIQAAKDGTPNTDIAPLMSHIENLYGVFETLLAARKDRGALDLDLPERKTIIDDKGYIKGIVPRTRLDSHMLIEELMVLTNVAAAMALEQKSAPCVYRIHAPPESSRIESAADFLETFGIRLDKGMAITPKNLNGILQKAKDTDESELVSMMVLRSQSQAVYSPDNQGHFGLALEKYAHFTSPIRRYADLMVHRSMVSAYNMPGGGGLQIEDHGTISQTAQHISETERKSMIAERDAMDRYTALYLQDRVGNEFPGTIAGVNNAGLFVKLNETGADGLIPMRSLPNDFYIYNEEYHCLIGRRSKQTFRLMAPVRIKLIEADPVKGSMLFELVEYLGKSEPPKGASLPERSDRSDPRKRYGKKPASKKRGDRTQKSRAHQREEERTAKKSKKKKTTPKHKKRKAKRKTNAKSKPSKQLKP